jgi:hypothetical protein
MRLFLPVLFLGCGGADSGSSIAVDDREFAAGRTAVIDATVMAWNDAMTFNNGYERRSEPAFEMIASQSVFDPERDLLSIGGSAFLDVVHAFRFGDGLHLRINDSSELRAGDRLDLDSSAGNPRWQVAFKLGAEHLEGGAERDDPRRGFRLPGLLTARLEINAINRDADEAITRLQATLTLDVARCPPSEHNRGEGEAYRPGSLRAELDLIPMSERLAEHNLKLLLGLSPLPLPDNNGFEFPGFTLNCRLNPRPPID